MRIITFFKHETPINQVTLLRDALRPHLSWHGARLSFLAAFLIALLRVKTVNFSNGYTNSNQLPLKSMDAQPKALLGDLYRIHDKFISSQLSPLCSTPYDGVARFIARFVILADLPLVRSPASFDSCEHWYYQFNSFQETHLPQVLPVESSFLAVQALILGDSESIKSVLIRAKESCGCQFDDLTHSQTSQKS